MCQLVIAVLKEVEKMAYETKVILSLLARQVANSGSVAEAYAAIRSAANVEEMLLPPYEELVQELKKEKE